MNTRNQNDSRGTDKVAEEIVVFSILQPSACAECRVELSKGSFLRMEHDKPLCLECADLDHLMYLPRGDTALTRRSRKFSALSAVVVRFSRARHRYERQGVLVEEAALERAEKECLSDEAQRRIARERAAAARERADARYVAEFAQQIRARFPGCPPGVAEDIARHACEKYSGRVGRSAGAKAFDANAIELAVKARIRHQHTDYDRLLAKGYDRHEARTAVAGKVMAVMERWSEAGSE
jgi:hypothetical protein